MSKGAKLAKGAKRPVKRLYTAKTADKHVLYEKSVQACDFEVDLLTSVFKRRVGRKPYTLREDFCGTALLCSEWVSSDPKRRANGVDLDRSVLAWGKENNIAPLGEDAVKRVTLERADVRSISRRKFDVVVAFNYSYYCFKDRDTLRGYFESVRRNLAPDGLFFMDLFGGYESCQVIEETRRYNGFRYVWHQAAYNPITGDFKAYIHFRFPDGTALEKAFTYDWRMWTIPELRELLAEAGFTDTECLWEGEDEDGDGNGEFKPKKIADYDAAYNAYLVSQPERSAR